MMYVSPHLFINLAFHCTDHRRGKSSASLSRRSVTSFQFFLKRSDDYLGTLLYLTGR
jgi:hypothetical protein